MKRFFLKPPVKACLLGMLTIIVGILSNVATSKGIWWVWAVFGVLAVSDIVTLFLYAKADNSLLKELDETKEYCNAISTSLQSYVTSLQGVTEICKFCAQKANVQVHEIIEKSRLDCTTWNFDVASESVCKAIYEYVLKNFGVEETDAGIVDIEVAYVKLEEGNKRQNLPDRISLCGHYHPTRNGPKIQGKKRDIDQNGYYDAQLFYKNVDSPDILLNPDEIQSAFKGKNNNDRSQFLGIPVFCSTSDNTSKMVGLLEIVCHGKSILSTDRVMLEKMANLIFTPYAYLFLLLFKMDKALKAIPKKGKK